MNINNISPDDNSYLQITKTIAKPPISLYLLGKLPENRRPTVAIVGTRKPTAYGREIGYQMAYQLAKRGVVIVSGLALGMDAIAHRAAVDAGGTTIAVMAGGLDRIHPLSHRELAKDILRSGGALVSEYSPGVAPYKSSFIERNRLVAGISDGLLVVEATAKSGTMHTANFALEQGRSVMAVPGNITSAVSVGCNNLIATGARPITKVDDILHELGLQGTATQPSLPLGDGAEEQAILDLIVAGERDGEQLQQKSRLSPAIFTQTLTMLEITGKIRPLGGNNWGL